MLCNDCKCEMDKGVLSKVYFWRQGTRESTKVFQGVLAKMMDINAESNIEDALNNEKVENLIAFRCPECKKVVLYTEEIE